jgi:ABC-type nickel/cobalt efflux system permease component RcnA
VLLGISATLSHTAVVWLVALAGMYFGSQWSAESSEPYFQVASGVLIIGVALWMAYRTWQQAREEVHGHHHDETKWINTGHGMLRVDIFEENVPPRFRLSTEHGMHAGQPLASRFTQLAQMAPNRPSSLSTREHFWSRSMRFPSRMSSKHKCFCHTAVTSTFMTSNMKSITTTIMAMMDWTYRMGRTRMLTSKPTRTTSSGGSLIGTSAPARSSCLA